MAEVVVTTYAEGYDSRRGGYDMELSVLRGDTGLPKWKWAWVSSTNDLCAPLLVNLSGDGKRVICLGVQEATPDSSRYSMVMLSHTGDVMNRFPIDFASSLQPWAALDTDRDGREELLYLSQSELRAHRGIDQEVVWKRPTQPFQIRLTEVRNSPAGDRDTLIAWENRTVLGLNPATGNARWRCDIPRLDGYDFQSTIAEMKSPSDPPQIATTGSHTKSTLIQQAWPADAVGGYQVPLGKQVDFGKYVEPVRYRSLPWSRHRVNAGELALAVALLASFCWSACRGQWSWLTIKIVAFGLITVGFGSLMLLMSHSLGSGERYSLQGWYWILLSGSTVTGLLLGAFWVLRFVMQRVSTLVRAAK